MENKDIASLCFNGDEENLKQTINTQPAIVTTSIAALEALKSLTNIEPYVVAGHSLGEYSAMYSANVLDLEQTLIAIQKRAMLMNKIDTTKWKEYSLKESKSYGFHLIA